MQAQPIQTKENPLWLHLQQNLQVQEEMMRATAAAGTAPEQEGSQLLGGDDKDDTSTGVATDAAEKGRGQTPADESKGGAQETSAEARKRERTKKHFAPAYI